MTDKLLYDTGKFSLDDVFKMNIDKRYWFQQHRKYLKSLKDVESDPIELAIMYNEANEFVKLARLLKNQRPKRYYARINSGVNVGPFATYAAAYNAATKENKK